MQAYVESYRKHKNLKLAAAECGIPWQTLYVKLRKADEPVNLTSLSAVINDQDPDSFCVFVRENGFEVSETFRPHKSTYIRFKRIQRQFGSVKVSFDVQDVIDNRVDYDDANGCLVITGLPADLIDEIKKHKENQDEHAAD